MGNILYQVRRLRQPIEGSKGCGNGTPDPSELLSERVAAAASTLWLFRKLPAGDEQVQSRPADLIFGLRRGRVRVAGGSLGVDHFEVRRRTGAERDVGDPHHFGGMLCRQARVATARSVLSTAACAVRSSARAWS